MKIFTIIAVIFLGIFTVNLLIKPFGQGSIEKISHIQDEYEGRGLSPGDFCFSLYKSEEQAKKKGYNVTLPTGKTQVWRVPNIDIVIADKYGIIIGEIGPGKPYLPINGNKFYVWAKEKKYTGETFCIEIK